MKREIRYYLLFCVIFQFSVGELHAQDLDKNWVYIRSYDENGKEISAGKNFFDNNGKPTQSQVKSESTLQTLASQMIYDVQGRGVVSTLQAPINSTSFGYKNNFVRTSSGTSYDYTNFDWNNTFNSSNPYAKTDNPDALDYSVQGTLGWYYSDNNSTEPFVAKTGYPFSRADFYHDGTGAVRRNSNIGDQMRTGSGHEETSNNFPVQNELVNYLAILNKFFPAAMIGNRPSTLAGQTLQTLTTDADGLTSISVTDLSGKQVLMSGRADPTVTLSASNTVLSPAGSLAVSNTLSLSNVQPLYTLIFNTDNGVTRTGSPSGSAQPNDIQNLTISSPNQVTVTCLTCDAPSVYTGTGNNYVFSGGGYNYKITSASPFYVSATKFVAPLANPVVTIYDQLAATVSEPPTTSMQYFQLAVPSVVNITGSFSLYKMNTEQDITSGFVNGAVMGIGYYKIVALAPADPAAVNNVTVTYTNTYSDISYNYYNQLGQLLASITPNGVKALISNLAGYSASNPIPFATTYEYDLQGRLIAETSPDAGRSEFIYRQDGQIRFSQNAFQRASSNAGAGNAEKFSYTNYDDLGRPVETGEYAVTAVAFQNMKTNYTLQESTLPGGGLTGGTKLSTISSYYDLPASGLPAMYQQDPGFLKGTLSYTSNANSTTWYNYDDHGRTTRMVKQISGLTTASTYKTVDYTYNDQGNVTRVDYQKNTPAEHFVHYYSYDLDGRLTKVQTSRDDGVQSPQANYYYYLHGPLKRIEIGNQLQGIDYTYTAQGMLKTINSPTGVAANDPGKDGVAAGFAQDAFGMQMEYFSGDYARANSNITGINTGKSYYTGNVSGISWQSKKTSQAVSNDPSIQNPAMYVYTYDSKSQLTKATWASPNFSSGTFTSSGKFTEQVIDATNTNTYDANGNIQGLKHTDANGIAGEALGYYGYIAGTNKLSSVGASSGTQAASHASYAYNEIGALNKQTKGTNSTYIKYDATGLMTGVYGDANFTAPAIISYTYDELGNRISATTSNGTTYYVYDASGTVMAIYSGTTMSEVPVYGKERLGTYTVAGNSYAYELRDNVGSVRVVIRGTKLSNGQADVVTYNDYYPFGGIAQNDNPTYRYDYQGAYSEKDPKTNYNNFALRMYDAQIGRWLTTDPKSVGFSPYTGMGNKPVSALDKDGGDPSTHTDEEGNVLAVYNDGDNGVYKHADGTTKTQLDIQHMFLGSSAGGTFMGKTQFWDEFKNPDSHKPEGSIMFGESFKADIENSRIQADLMGMDLKEIGDNSKLNQLFDIKNSSEIAPYGPMTGKLLNGYYVTARSAGNYLAGYNGREGTIMGFHISFETYMKLAGALQQHEYTRLNAALITTFGHPTFGPAPYYGEQDYTGRMVLQGWLNAGK